jgi:type I restriction enzyme, S subunit
MKIGDFCEVTSSKRIFAKEYCKSGIPFFRSQEVIQKAMGQRVNPTIFISPERYKSLEINEHKIPKRGDILISAIGANRGFPWCVDGDQNFYFKDGNVIWLRNFKPSVSSSYLTYFLGRKCFIEAVQSETQHSAQGAITIDYVKAINIDVPDMAVQRHIVDTIGSLDREIELIHQKKELINAILKNSIRPLSRRVLFSSYRPKLVKTHVAPFEGKKVYLDTSCVEGTDPIDWTYFVDFRTKPSRASIKPIANTCWTARMKDSYKVLGITNKDSSLLNAILSTGFVGVQETEELPLPFLYSLFLSEDFRIRKDMSSTGATMMAINNDDFLNIEVPYLDEMFRSEYRKKYMPLMETLSVYREETLRLSQTKTLLLEKFF